MKTAIGVALAAVLIVAAWLVAMGQKAKTVRHDPFNVETVLSPFPWEPGN